MNNKPARMRRATAIKLAGSQANLARLLKRTDAAIFQWGEFIPKSAQWDLERIRPEWFETKRRARKTA